MRLLLILAALWVSVASAQTTATNFVFRADFEGADALKGWSPPPAGVRLVPLAAGSQALLVERPIEQGAGAIAISQSLPVAALRGSRVRFEARVRATDVAKPPNAWNGIKFMLHTDGPAGKRWEQQNNVFGTFAWKTVRFTTLIPEDATLAQLTLGLENTTGQAWFDDVRAIVLRAPRRPGSAPSNPGPVFKGHDLPRLRGAMIQPDITPESLQLFGRDWNANVLRWQLIRYLPRETQTPLAEYDAWLEGELRKLDAALPLCERYGIRVVIDLHSPPGGSRTASGYVGSDTGLFTNQAAQAKFVEVWQSMARRYRDRQVIWGFDIANEPVEEEVAEGCDDWQELATRTARAIREIDPRHAIIVEPSPWGSPDSIRNLDPLPVPGMVYSVHMYVPSQFTHQGIHGNPGGVTYPGTINGRPWDKEALRRTLQPVIDFQRDHNVHIYLGEFSAIRWAPGAADYLRDCIDLFEEHGWDWTYHAFREWNGWSVEHGPDPKDNRPSVTPTDRQKLLMEWFGSNQKPAK